MLDKLLSLTVQEDVFVTYQDLHTGSPKLHGIYFFDRDRQCGFVILDESLKQDESKHCAILAEELGHHFAGVHTNCVTSERENILKDEVAALRWAVHHLASFGVSGGM